MVISSTAEYALRAVTWLAQAPGEQQTTRQIADGTGVPPGYLAKVLHSLARAGLVTSQRGIKGGFLFPHEPAMVSALQVINAVDPIKRINCCPLGLKDHTRSRCQLHGRIEAAVAQVEKAFADASIADFEGSFSGPAGRRKVTPRAPNKASGKKRGRRTKKG